MGYRKGWAFGDVSTSPVAPAEWLTILGSAYMPPVLHADEAGARSALDTHKLRDNPRMSWAVAHITEVPHSGCSGGYAFKVTPGTLRQVTGTAAEQS